jgi:hypothetical protein
MKINNKQMLSMKSTTIPNGTMSFEKLLRKYYNVVYTYYHTLSRYTSYTCANLVLSQDYKQQLFVHILL